MTENTCDVCSMSFDSKESLIDHAKLHMKNVKTVTNSGRALISAVIGGIVGGVLMLLVLMGGASGMGLSSTTFALVMGMGLGASMGSAVMIGVLGHFIVSIVAGAIFGAIVSYVKPFRMKSGPRSIGLGVAFAIVLPLFKGFECNCSCGRT